MPESSARASTESKSSRPLFAGIDVGGTNIKIGLCDLGGHQLAATSFPTEDRRGPADAIGRIASQLRKLIESNGLANQDVATVGLGTPGTMDLHAGVILEPPNLPGWRHFPIRDALQQALSKPVAYANDANAAAYGEFWVGRAQHLASMVLLTLGTGVGGGIVINDQLLEGATGNASECGHITVDFSPQARLCSCGIKGHLEAYASATAVSHRAGALAVEDSQSALGVALRRGQKLGAKEVAAAASAGDELARQIVFEAADYLARGIVTIANIIDPDVVLLGGAMDFGGRDAELGKAFLQSIRTRVRSQTVPQIGQRLLVDFATLGPAAGWIGAAGLAKRLYDQEVRGSAN